MVFEFSGAETLAWLWVYFESFLNDVAFGRPAVEWQKVSPVAKAGALAANQQVPPPPSELDDQNLNFVLDIVREQRIVDISVVLGRLGNQDLRDPLLRSVEAHPNLRAHPGPRTIFLQWRITA